MVVDMSAEAGGIPRILLDLADGRLGPDEVDDVVAMLQADPAEPPSWLVNRAVRIAHHAEHQVERAPARPSVWRRLVASLVYDNRLQPRPAGARAAGAEPARLLYRAGPADVDLELGDSAVAGRVRVHGQVAAGDADVGRGRVVAEGPAGRLEAPVDDLGQFILDGLATGRHRVEIGLPFALIEIPTLEL